MPEPILDTTACNDPAANDPPTQGAGPLASKMGEESVTGSRGRPGDAEPWSGPDALQDLVGLFRHSTTLVEFLAPRKTRETAAALDPAEGIDRITDITTPGTPDNLHFARIVAHWRLDRQPFGSEHYFNVPIAAVGSHLDTPATGQGRQRACRLHGIFYQANLAAMVASLVTATTASEQIEFLECLDRIFPAPFLATVTRDDLARPDSSTLYVESAELALEIRTRCLVSRYMAAESRGLPSSATLDPFSKRWSILTEPTSNELKNRFIADLEKRFEPLGSHGHHHHHRQRKPQALRDLHDRYPWQSFAVQLITWAQNRTNEIHDYLEGHRDVDAVLNAFMAVGGRRPALMAPSRTITDPPIPAQPREIGSWGCQPQSPPEPAVKSAAADPAALSPGRSIDAPKATKRLM